MMKTANNKKAWELWRAYERATARSIFECYKTRPSYAKETAERGIKARMENENAHGYKVLSFSGFVFTCGYLDETETVLTVDTKSNTYRIQYNGDYVGRA